MSQIFSCNPEKSIYAIVHVGVDEVVQFGALGNIIKISDRPFSISEIRRFAKRYANWPRSLRSAPSIGVRLKSLQRVNTIIYDRDCDDVYGNYYSLLSIDNRDNVFKHFNFESIVLRSSGLANFKT